MTNHVHLIALPVREDSLVERDSVRAGMVRRAADYRWSSAASHLAGEDEIGCGLWAAVATQDASRRV